LGGGVREALVVRAEVAPAPSGHEERLHRINEQAAGLTFGTGPGGALLPPRALLDGTAGRIHEAALVLFSERGYHAVSMRDLAAEVGVKPSSIYAHVASKQQLLTSLVRAGHLEHRDTLRASLLESGSGPDEQLRSLTRAHVTVHATYPLLTRVCNRELASLSDEHREEVLAIRVDAQRMFLDVIERGQRLGEFGMADPILAVAAIGAMGMRVADWWNLGVGVSVEELADTYATFALRMVLP
jgi:AcrR family transcriptional regulator